MLNGIKVLSFTHYLQGPLAAQTLADLGADVVKVEPLSGAYERNWSGGERRVNDVSLFFLVGNRNQRSLSLDLKTDAGKEIIRRLIMEYDVVVTNFRPNAMKRLGLSYEDLREINPRLIYCSCTGWGEDGPYVERPGQDLIVQGVSGIAAQNGPAERPYPMGTIVLDVHGGTLAALGILAAVYSREKTGAGRTIDTSLLNAAIDLQSEMLGYYMNTGVQMPRVDTGLGTRAHASPYGIYSTSDGYLALNGHGDQKKLRAAFGDRIFDSIPYCYENRAAIDAMIADVMRTKTTAEWTAVFAGLDMWYAAVNDYPEMLEDPQVRHNDPFLEMDHPVAGKIRVVNHPNRFDGKPLPLRRLPPELGDSSAELLRECGYSADETDELLRRGVVKDAGHKESHS